MDWKDVDKELPEKDGMYEITNRIDGEKSPIWPAFYDGIGFESMGVYRNPKYWRKSSVEKKYGKIK